MPVTSLAAQLKRLEVPQTSLLLRLEKKTRTSFLFEAKEAANFDRNTFFELGINGLEELKKLNPDFEKFESTLFNSVSKNFERAVETSETNKVLNEEISKFLAMLLPYFLLKPSHKALEWLIYRYHIEEFNTNDLLMLGLIYHETILFPRLVRLVRLKDNSRWSWLKPIQKEGVPLSKTALLNRAATDLAFLKTILSLPSFAIQVLKEKAGSLSTLFAFYCSTAVGALEYIDNITDVHISHLLPSLTEALSSNNLPDYTASAFMILARLVTKVSLAKPLLDALYNKISKVDIERLKMEKVLVMVILAQSDGQRNKLPNNATKRLTGNREQFVQCLASLTDSGIITSPLVLAALSSALGDNNFRPLAHDMLVRIQYEPKVIQQIFRLLLDKFTEGDLWWIDLFKSLERKYPSEFDKMTSTLGKGNKKLNRALEGMIGSQGESIEKLNHPNPRVRIQALKGLATNYNSNNASLYMETVILRLGESLPNVLSAVFKLPSSLLGHSEIRPHVIKAVLRIWENPDLSNILQSAVTALLSSHLQLNTTAVMALLPPLLYSNNDNNNIISTVFNSEVLQKSQFLAAIHKRYEECGNIRSALLGVLLENKDIIPKSIEVEECVKDVGNPPCLQFLALLIASAAMPTYHHSPKAFTTTVNKAHHYIDSPQLKGSKISSEQLDEEGLKKGLVLARKGYLPVEGILYSVGELAKRSTISLPWLSSNSPVLEVFRIISKGLNSTIDHISRAFHEALSSFYKIHNLEGKSRILLGLNTVIYAPECGLEIVTVLLKQLEEKSESYELSDEHCLPLVLLALAAAPLQQTRSKLLEMVELISQSEPTSVFQMLAQQVLQYKDEIILDPDQLSVCLYTKMSPAKEVQSLLTPQTQSLMSEALAKLLHLLLLHTTPVHIKASLLNILEFVTSEELFAKLAPMLSDLIGSGSTLTKDQSLVVKLILKRIEPTSFSDNRIWVLLKRVLEDQTTIVKSEENGVEKPTCPAVLLLQQVSKEMFDSICEPKLENQERLLGAVVTTAADSENVQVGSATSSFFKKIVVDASTVVNLLSSMQNATVPPPMQKTRARTRKSVIALPPLEILETPDWKRGVCLLELIQTKKKMKSIHLLLPTLFEILKKCMQFEQQAPVEYTKQLVLTCILHCCQSSDSQTIVELVQVDPIVQCVRSSHNPQTHHHALLTLTYMAHIVPDQVLHNIMAIFTFIGSSVLRQDDAYSFQIISKIVDTIVPVLVKSGQGEVVICVKIFVSAMLDIPEHRRLPLFSKLLDTLDNGHYLWLFLCSVFESHVVSQQQLQHNVIQDDKSKTHINEMPKKLEVALQLCLDFPVSLILETIHKLLSYVLSLPNTKEDKDKSGMKQSLKFIFDIESNTDKQLRHYKYTLVLFLSSLLSSSRFVQQVALLTDEEMESLETNLGTIVECSLKFIKNLSKQVEESSGLPTFKYCKAMLNQSYEILDKTTALLSGGMFVNVVGGLIISKEGSLVRRGSELLGWRLGQSSSSPLPQEPLLNLLPHVLACLDKEDDPLTVQTMLVTLKLLARHLASTNIKIFVQVLGKVSSMLVHQQETNSNSWPVIGSLILCIGELVSSIRTHSVNHLNTFMPPMLDILQDSINLESGDLFAASVITGLSKIVETLSHFQNPYLSKLLYHVSNLSAKYQPGHPILQKLKTIRQRISADIRVKILIVSVSSCFKELINDSHYLGVAPLMSVLADSFTSSGDLSAEVSSFFMEALNFRCKTSDELSVEIVEPHVISALTSLALKLSESAFRPLYYKLYDWAVRSNQNKKRAITFYRLSSNICESLKGLFVLFAGHVISNAALLLDKNNLIKEGDDCGKLSEADSCLLLNAILSTLLGIFTYDAQHFVNKERFDLLMHPLVDQLENTAGGEETANKRWIELVGPCLAQMAVSIGDDSLWKQLNYQILLKTRHPSPKVRLGGLRTVCLVAGKLGEDFLPLLPETVPFLAELLEDSEEEVEHETQKVVRDLENILGEPIQKYF